MRRIYSCDICPKQFETPSKLARHYLTHTGQKPFQCLDCNKTFRQLVHLERHKMTHTMPFQCNICERNFRKFETFSEHQHLHELFPNELRPAKKPFSACQKRHLSIPYYCSRCQVTFSTEEKWQLHRCKFLDDISKKKCETQRCEVCEKVFPSWSKLERHLLIHTGQRPFTCALCGKSFRQKSHLKIHQLTHSQDRPFQCSHCFKSFKTQGKLIKHEEVHTQQTYFPNMLNKCRDSRTVELEDSRFFESVKEESSEVFSVYVIPFQCPTCEQCFETQQVLDKHTCFVTKEGKMVNSPRRTFTRRSARQKNRTKAQLEPASKVPPVTPVPIGRLVKPDQSGGAKLLAIDTPVCQERGSSLVHEAHTQRKVQRQIIGQTPTIMKRPPQNQDLGVHRQEYLETGSPDSSTSVICISDEEETEIDHDTLHHFLQGAQGLVLQRHNSNKCDQCEKVFQSLSKLRRHYLIHTGQKPFACSECGKKFRQSAHLKRHQVTHIQKSNLHRSNEMLGDFYQVFGHQVTHADYPFSQEAAYSTDPQEGFQGSDSDTQYEFPVIKVEIEPSDVSTDTQESPTVLIQDSRTIEPREGFSNSHSEHPPRRRRTWGVRRSYRCSVCTKIFLSPSKLERHYLIHAGERPFECADCGKSFRQDPHLKRHQMTHRMKN
ncbi:zinc finger protein 770 [Rhinophrynus dorsalis]